MFCFRLKCWLKQWEILPLAWNTKEPWTGRYVGSWAVRGQKIRYRSFSCDVVAFLNRKLKIHRSVYPHQAQEAVYLCLFTILQLNGVLHLETRAFWISRLWMCMTQEFVEKYIIISWFSPVRMLCLWEMPEITLFWKTADSGQALIFVPGPLPAHLVCQLVSCNFTFAPLSLKSLQLSSFESLEASKRNQIMFNALTVLCTPVTWVQR